MTWTLALVVVTSLAASRVTCQFNPGCSFVGGQCMYQVQLGHAGSCDSVKRDATADGQCCGQLEAKVTELTGDVTELKSQVATLMSELISSKSNLSETTGSLTEAERRTQELLDTLAQREAELNQTQHELSNVLSNAGDEIRALRNKVGELTANLNTCRGTLGLATNTTVLPVSGILGSDVHLSYCNFEDMGNGTDAESVCGFSNPSSSLHWKRRSGRISTETGPVEDHTMGSPKGHYMYMDAQDVARLTTSTTSSHSVLFTSPTYSPSMRGYCVRFWYNMRGRDVKTFNVYADMVGAGRGYPVFTMTGDKQQYWHMGEVDLDSEYTSRSFQILFEATSQAYHSTYSSHSLLHDDGDIALDDVYVYNTSCNAIPLCPPNGVTRDVSGKTYCYTFFTQPATWYEAAKTCRQQGATTSLVTIDKQEEQDFIVTTIKADPALTTAGQYGFYTAGNDERSEHSFEWTDTGTPYSGTYSNWKTGQPNDVGSDQDCLLLEYPDQDFLWGDVDCDTRHPFICEVAYPTPQAASGAMVG